LAPLGRRRSLPTPVKMPWVPITVPDPPTAAVLETFLFRLPGTGNSLGGENVVHMEKRDRGTAAYPHAAASRLSGFVQQGD